MKMIRKSNSILFFLSLLGSNLDLYGGQVNPNMLVPLETIGSRQVAVLSSLVPPQTNNTCGPRVADALFKLYFHLTGHCSVERTKKKLLYPPRSLPQNGRGMDGDQLYRHICRVHGPTCAKKVLIIDIPIDQLLTQWDPVTFQLMDPKKRNHLAHQIYHLRSRYHGTPWNNNPILVLLQAAQEEQGDRSAPRASTMSHWVGLADTPKISYFLDTYDGSRNHAAEMSLSESMDQDTLTALKESVEQQREIEKLKTENIKQYTLTYFQQIINNPSSYPLYPLLISPELHSLATENISQEPLEDLKSLLAGLSDTPIQLLDNFEQTKVGERISLLFDLCNLGAVPKPEQLADAHQIMKDVSTVAEAQQALLGQKIEQLCFSLVCTGDYLELFNFLGVHNLPKNINLDTCSDIVESIRGKTYTEAQGIATRIISEQVDISVQPVSSSGSESSESSESRSPSPSQDQTPPRTWWQRFCDYLFCRKRQRSFDSGERGQQATQEQLDHTDRQSALRKQAPRAAILAGFLAATLKVLAGIFGSSS